jgi:uncharacterized protein YggU (UPF0235/DUF167 family)
VIRVRERALENAANRACIEALAAALRVPPSSVTLVRGTASRHKMFEIAGLTTEAAFTRLRTKPSAQRPRG